MCMQVPDLRWAFCWVFLHYSVLCQSSFFCFAHYNYAEAFSRSRSLCRPSLTHNIFSGTHVRPGHSWGLTRLPSRPHKSWTFFVLDLLVSSLHQLRWDAISASEPKAHEPVSGGKQKWICTYLYISSFKNHSWHWMNLHCNSVSLGICRPSLTHNNLFGVHVRLGHSWTLTRLSSRPSKSWTFLGFDLLVTSLRQLRWDAISSSEPESHEPAWINKYQIYTYSYQRFQNTLDTRWITIVKQLSSWSDSIPHSCNICFR